MKQKEGKEGKDMESRARNTRKKQRRHMELLANATSRFAAHVN